MSIMRWVKVVAAVGVVVFLTMIVLSSLEMNLWQGLKASSDSLWGVLTLIDVYTGLFLFTGFIAFRERSLWRVGLWFLALVTLGNLATLAYVLVSCGRCRTVAEVFQPVR